MPDATPAFVMQRSRPIPLIPSARALMMHQVSVAYGVNVLQLNLTSLRPIADNGKILLIRGIARGLEVQTPEAQSCPSVQHKQGVLQHREGVQRTSATAGMAEAPFPGG